MLFRHPTNPRYLRSIPFTIPKNLCSKSLLLLLRHLTHQYDQQNKNKMEHKENKNSTPQWNKGHQVETSNFPLPYSGPWPFTLPSSQSTVSLLAPRPLLPCIPEGPSGLLSILLYLSNPPVCLWDWKGKGPGVGWWPEPSPDSVCDVGETELWERETRSLGREKEETLIPTRTWPTGADLNFRPVMWDIIECVFQIRN